MHGHKAKTGNAQVKKVGHTSGSRFGQNPQQKGRGENSGSEQSYK